jgi:hypothetical protein
MDFDETFLIDSDIQEEGLYVYIHKMVEKQFSISTGVNPGLVASH